MGFFSDFSDAIGGFFGGHDTNGDGTPDGGGLIDALNGDGYYGGEPNDRNGDGKPDGGGLLDALDGSGTFGGYKNGHGGGLLDSINGDGKFMGIESGNVFSGGWVGLDSIQNITVAHSIVKDNFRYIGSSTTFKDQNIAFDTLSNLSLNDMAVDIEIASKIDTALAEMALTEEGFAMISAAIENNNNQKISINVADLSGIGVMAPAMAINLGAIAQDEETINELKEAGLLSENFTGTNQKYGIMIDINALEHSFIGLENGTSGSLSLERALVHELTHIAEDHLQQLSDGTRTVTEVEYETVDIVNNFMAKYYGEEKRGDYYNSGYNETGTPLADLSIDIGAITGSEVANNSADSSDSSSPDDGDYTLSRHDILQSSNPIKTIVTNVVARGYNDILGREADQEDLDAHVNNLLSGEQTIDQIRENIQYSDEGIQVAVANIYSDVLGREADSEGEAYWTDRIKSGDMTIEAVRESIEYSDEGISTFIDNTYASILEREPDQAGKDFYTEKVKSGEIKLLDVVDDISNSPEATELQVTKIYEEVLERSPDDAGLAFYIEQINDGNITVDGVRENIAGSPEAQDLKAQKAAEEQAAADAAAAEAAAELRTEVTADTKEIYNEVLDRDADEEGLEFWVDQVVDNGLNVEEVREHISNSDEAQSLAQQEADAAATEEAARLAQENENAIKDIYEGVLERDADDAGLEYYVDQVVSGNITVDGVRENIAGSPEAQDLKAQKAAEEQAAADAAAAEAAAELRTEVTADTKEIYNEVLDRDADEEGLEFWVDQVVDNGLNVEEVREHISNSDEAQSLAQQEADAAARANDPLEQLYNDVLGRDPDTAGKEFWQQQLDNGMSIAEVKDHFKQSEEFQQKTPLVLDLDGDGFELTQVWNGVAFDIDNDGIKEDTAWAGSDDGLLAYDENNDGIINDQSELFGDTDTLTDGFNKLVRFDSNNDNRIDKNDDIFQELVVWQDSNQDGVSDKNEMHSLKDLEIESISLNAETHNDLYIQDNWISHTSEYTKTDGTSHDVFDAWFQYDDTNNSIDSSEFTFINDEIDPDVVQAFNSEEGERLNISDYLDCDKNEVQDAINDFVFTAELDVNSAASNAGITKNNIGTLDVSVIGHIENNGGELVFDQSESVI